MSGVCTEFKWKVVSVVTLLHLRLYLNDADDIGVVGQD